MFRNNLNWKARPVVEVLMFMGIWCSLYRILLNASGSSFFYHPDVLDLIFIDQRTSLDGLSLGHLEWKIITIFKKFPTRDQHKHKDHIWNYSNKSKIAHLDE